MCYSLLRGKPRINLAKLYCHHSLNIQNGKFNNGEHYVRPCICKDNATELRQAVVVLLVVGAMILLGNTMYAPSMRGIVYLLHRSLGDEFSRSNGLGYLLDHPRKCFTHMFPFHQTLWLTVTVILFNSVELFFFCVLDWNSPPLQGLSGKHDSHG